MRLISYAVALATACATGCYASHAEEGSVRRPWPGPGPDPCRIYPPVFARDAFFGETLSAFFPGPGSDYPFIFRLEDPYGPHAGSGFCIEFNGACPLADCASREDLDHAGYSTEVCLVEPNNDPEYVMSEESRWCYFETREQCECECLGRC